MKRGEKGILLFLTLITVFCSAQTVLASSPSINNITLEPDLDLSYFNNYNITANITNTSPIDSVIVNVTIINGDGNDCGQYYANGSCAERGPTTHELSLVSQDIYRRTHIRPDDIYPQIEFADDSIYWHNRPQNRSLNKDSIHLFHFTNNYSDDPNMSFWIEFDASPTNPTLTKDLVVYVIERGHDITYFQGSDWRNNPQGVSLVETFTRTTPKSHTHTENSSHYLVTLTADANGTIGNKRVNVTGDFWVALYSNAPPSQGWNLAYRNDTLCNTTGLWYTQKQGTWTTTQQSGCPDAHIHLARRNDLVDGLSISVSANYTDGNSTTNTTNATFEELPTLPPLPTAFTYPQNGTYSGWLNITWIQSIDPNGDPVTYNLSLLNADGTFNTTLNTSTNLTYFYWDSTTMPDGTYDLMVVACDPSNSCSNFTLGGLYDNFTIDNTPPIVKLIAPPNGTSSPVNAYNFTFNVTDLSEITSCILIFNTSIINNLTTVYRDAENNFSNSSLPTGDFNWGVNCTDIAGNTANSGSFGLTITPLYNLTNISVTKTDNPDPVNVSSNLTYQITISSIGNGTAHNVTLNETYPEQVIYLESQPAPTAGNNSWNLGNLAQGTSITINITLFVINVSNGTIINNTANVTYNNETGAVLNAYDTESTLVLVPPTTPPTPSGGGGGGRAARAFYPYPSYRKPMPKTQPRVEEAAMLPEREQAQQDAQEDFAEERAQRNTELTGNAVRQPVVTEYLAVAEQDVSQKPLALLVSLILIAVIGAIILINIRHTPKNKIVIRLHRGKEHHNLVVHVKRDSVIKKQDD